MPEGTCKGVPRFQALILASNQHFPGRSLPQKRRGAGARTIGSGAENGHQITLASHWKSAFFRQAIERGAQAANHTGHLPFAPLARPESGGDGGGIVAPDNCPKMTRCRQLVVKPPIGDKKYFTMT